LAVRDRRRIGSEVHRSEAHRLAYVKSSRRASTVISRDKAKTWQATCNNLPPTQIPVLFSTFSTLLLARRFKVLIYLSRYFEQGTANGPFRSSSQTATCYYQFKHSKVEAIPLSALPKNTTSELAGLFPH